MGKALLLFDISLSAIGDMADDLAAGHD